ncbi:MAG: hypothetical protein U9R27_00050 [Campylobacterota bacterium]|nr:hypothetical protein [Campylobacterota bacterium]
MMRYLVILDKNSIKKIAYFLGKSLGILGMLFLFYKLSQEYTLASFREKFFLLIDIVPPLLILNLISMIMGIYVWHMMLLHYAKREFPYRVSYYFFAKTEIAKYLPGNIFHFVGRQLLAKKIDLSQSQMMKISGLFTLLLAVATIVSGAIFSIFGTGISAEMMLFLVFIAIVSIVLSLTLFPSFPKVKKIEMDFILTTSIGLQGVMMGVIIFSQIDIGGVGLFLQIAGIYVFSWLVGFVTPGASGGIGVREGAFIAIAEFVHSGISSEIILFSILFIRLINIVADLLAYLSTYLLKNKEYI